MLWREEIQNFKAAGSLLELGFLHNGKTSVKGNFP